MYIEIALFCVILWLIFQYHTIKSTLEEIQADLDGLYEDLTGDEIVEGDLFVTGTVHCQGNVSAYDNEAAVRSAANRK